MEVIGKVFRSNSYGEFEVIDRSNKKHSSGNALYTIRFFKTGYTYNTLKSSIVKGRVMDRLLPVYYDVGYLGDAYNSSHFLYNRWFKMLQRCYDSKNKKDFKNYGAKGVKVCNRWLCFSNYVDDCLELQGFNEALVKSGDLELDKDINGNGVNIYSSEYCIWVKKSDNIKEMNARVKQKEFIATRLSDGHEEMSNNITTFSKKYSITSLSISRCLRGELYDSKGWRFRYNDKTLIYRHENMKTNKSGFIGVCKRGKKWRAFCHDNKKQKSLGVYEDIIDAVISRYIWEVQSQGKFRVPNNKDSYLREMFNLQDRTDEEVMELLLK